MSTTLAPDAVDRRPSPRPRPLLDADGRRTEASTPTVDTVAPTVDADAAPTVPTTSASNGRRPVDADAPTPPDVDPTGDTDAPTVDGPTARGAHRQTKADIKATTKAERDARRKAAAAERRRITARLAYTAQGRTKAASTVILVGAVLALLFNAVTSFTDLYEYAVTAGRMPSWLAWIVPFGIDTFIVIGVAGTIVHRNETAWSWQRIKAWLVLLAFDAASAYGQVAGASVRDLDPSWVAFVVVFPIGVAVAANQLEGALSSMEKTIAAADVVTADADAAADAERRRLDAELTVLTADARRRRPSASKPTVSTVKAAPSTPSASAVGAASPSTVDLDGGASTSTLTVVPDGHADARIKAAYDGGSPSWADVARKAGVSRSTASTRGRRMGLTLPRP
jgi:hypothetical protein